MARFDIEDWKRRRQRCRTDLRYLCGVLNYRDVSKTVHGAMYKHVQKFKGGEEPRRKITVKDGAGYKPACSMWELEGKRKRLNLVTRGGLKTTILTQAHSIQWIINYPNVRILLVSARLERAKDFLKGIKEAFTKNEMFRFLFPEFCPKDLGNGKTEDFGDSEQFTVPCRTMVGIKEPTCRVSGADSSVAGGHYDVEKVDDLVEDQNVRTPGSIEQTKKFFGSLNPLRQDDLINPDEKGWIDLTGTIYSFSDLHFTIKSEEEKKPEQERQWDILYIPAATDYGTDKAVPWWPERISLKKLRGIETDPAEGPNVLYPQYLLKPLQDKDGLIKTKEDIQWIPRAELNALSARINWNVTVDLAGMGTSVGSDADYDVINLHGWGTDGRCYFDKIIWGRIPPDQVIDHLFKLYRYQPRIMFFKIEAEAHSRILMPYLQKEMGKNGKPYLPVMELKRDNNVSKVHRIRGTQPYWKNGAFRFASDLDIDAKEQLILEALYFPKFNHDDILDTVTDSLQSRDGIVPDVQGREKMFPEQAQSDYKEWRGIPVQSLSWEMLQGMTEDEYEGGLGSEFNPSESLFQ